MSHITRWLWELLQARMYTNSARRLLGRMRWLVRRHAFLIDKMSGRSRYYVDGYGHYRTQVREVDEQLQQALQAIERLATAAEAKQLVRSGEPMQRLVGEARRILGRAERQRDRPENGAGPKR